MRKSVKVRFKVTVKQICSCFHWLCSTQPPRGSGFSLSIMPHWFRACPARIIMLLHQDGTPAFSHCKLKLLLGPLIKHNHNEMVMRAVASAAKSPGLHQAVWPRFVEWNCLHKNTRKHQHSAGLFPPTAMSLAFSMNWIDVVSLSALTGPGLSMLAHKHRALIELECQLMAWRPDR